MISIDIGLDEVWDSLRRADKLTLCDWLEDEDYLKKKNLIKFDRTTYESFHDEDWALNLEKLLANRSMLTAEEEAIINNLAKRF